MAVDNGIGLRVSNNGAPLVTRAAGMVGLDLVGITGSYAAGTLTLTGGLPAPLYVENANTIAQRNGTTAQQLQVYNTYTDANNYERGLFQWTGNALRIGSDNLGSGVSRAVQIYSKGAGGIGFVVASNLIWTIAGTTGHFLANTDNTYDIGASGANRPRSIYVAQSVTASGNLNGAALYGTSSVGVASRYLLSGGASDGLATLTNSGNTRNADLTLGGITAFNNLATTGTTRLVVRAGAGDAATDKLLQGVLNDGTTEVWNINRAGKAWFGGGIEGMVGTGGFTLSTALGGPKYVYAIDSATGLALHSSWAIKWGSVAADSTKDLGIARSSAGLLEVNNGTTGQYRDMIMRKLSLAGGTGTLPATVAAPLEIGVDSMGGGFVISNSATEYTRFVSGGVMKGMLGVGSVPFTIQNGGDIYFAPGSGATELRNGGAAQVLNVYNTFTDTSNYERFFVGWSGNRAFFATQSAGTGAARELVLASSSSIVLRTANVADRWVMSSGGHLSAQGAYDLIVGGVTGNALATKISSVSGLYPGIWFGANTTTPSTTNYSMLYDGGSLAFNATTGNSIGFRINNINRIYATNTAVGLGPNNTSPTGTVHIYDATATTGITRVIFRAGAGDAAGDKILQGLLNDGTTEKWSITRDGVASFTNYVLAAGVLSTPASYIGIQSRSLIYSSANGFLEFRNNQNNAYSLATGLGFVWNQTAAPTLANGQATLHVASDTSVVITLKGSDGVTRTASITLS